MPNTNKGSVCGFKPSSFVPYAPSSSAHWPSPSFLISFPGGLSLTLGLACLLRDEGDSLETFLNHRFVDIY
ncbi:hypothetical protein NMG60_11020568 [Bertholletia excelsa]